MKKILSIAVITIMCASVLTGCWGSKPPAATPSPTAATDGTTIKTNEGGTIQSGENLIWPVDQFENLPALKGTITSIIKSETECTIVLSKVEKKDAEAYFAVIKSEFAQVIDVSTPDDMIFYNGTKDDKTMTFTYNYKDNSATIIYGKTKK